MSNIVDRYAGNPSDIVRLIRLGRFLSRRKRSEFHRLLDRIMRAEGIAREDLFVALRMHRKTSDLNEQYAEALRAFISQVLAEGMQRDPKFFYSRNATFVRILEEHSVLPPNAQEVRDEIKKESEVLGDKPSSDPPSRRRDSDEKR